MVIRIKSAVVVALGLIASFHLWAQAASESQLEATFICNSLQFVEWPTETLPAPDSNIVLGILGKDPFGTEIDRAFQHKKINGHSVMVRRLKGMDEIHSCHVLFVSRSEERKVREIVEQIGDRGILSVSDIKGFAGRGGVLGLTRENGRLSFEINLNVVKRARLQISSKLLRLAKIIEGKGR